eukprot:12800951-Heterocapsa_arctica.AAC.1
MMITHSRHSGQLTLKIIHTQDNSRCSLWGLTGGGGHCATPVNTQSKCSLWGLTGGGAIAQPL